MNDLINYRGFKVEISPSANTDVYCLAYCDEECSVEFDMFTLKGALKDKGEEGRELSAEEYTAVAEKVKKHIDTEYDDWMQLAQKYKDDYPLSSEIYNELQRRKNEGGLSTENAIKVKHKSANVER